MKARRRSYLAAFSAFLCLLTAVTASGQTMLFRGVLDMPGDWDGSAFGVTLGFDSELGVSFAVELAVTATKDYAAGFGVECQLDREIDASATGAPTDPEFGFVPIYAFGKYIADRGPPSIFLVARLGYNVMHKGNDFYEEGSDLSGGMFYAFGAGAGLANGSEVELTYAVSQGKMEASGMTMDIEYSRVSIAFSYAFRF